MGDGAHCRGGNVVADLRELPEYVYALYELYELYELYVLNMYELYELARVRVCARTSLPFASDLARRASLLVADLLFGVIPCLAHRLDLRAAYPHARLARVAARRHVTAWAGAGAAGWLLAC